MSRRALKQPFLPTPQLQLVRQRAAVRRDKLIQHPTYGLKIADEATGQALDFRFRWEQAVAYEIYQQEVRKNIPVRLWFLKARRVGLTSLFAADEYLDAWSMPNRRIGIVAHLEHRAKEILDQAKFFHRHMHPDLRVPLARDFTGGLKFAGDDFNSEFVIGTCAEPEKVRGGGLHRGHLSEAAYYKKNFKKTLKEISTVIAPAPGTALIIETTGRGRGSDCHLHWEAAKAKGNIYRAVFLPWQKNPATHIPFESARAMNYIMDEIREYEPRLLEKCLFYKLPPEQTHWAYRHAYIYRCDMDYEYFCHEYPFNDQEAWDTSGTSFFGDNEIAAMELRTQEPMIFTFGERFINQSFKTFAELEEVSRPPENDSGLIISVYAAPKAGRRYAIGGDCSLGETDGDYSAGSVVEIESRQLMCTYRGRIRPDEHAFVMYSLGMIYNVALLAPEINPNGGGLQVLNDLQRMFYPNIYIWRLRDDKKGIILSQKLGWATNQWSRPLMLNELRKMFRDCAHGRFPDPGMFPDKVILNEMRTFQRDLDSGRIEAADNSYDDSIFGLAIAHRVAADEVHGGGGDIYATYNTDATKQPFSELLAILEAIQDSPDAASIISQLSNGKFDLNNGSINWHEQ